MAHHKSSRQPPIKAVGGKTLRNRKAQWNFQSSLRRRSCKTGERKTSIHRAPWDQGGPVSKHDNNVRICWQSTSTVYSMSPSRWPETSKTTRLATGALHLFSQPSAITSIALDTTSERCLKTQPAPRNPAEYKRKETKKKLRKGTAPWSNDQITIKALTIYYTIVYKTRNRVSERAKSETNRLPKRTFHIRFRC